MIPVHHIQRAIHAFYCRGNRTCNAIGPSGILNVESLLKKPFAKATKNLAYFIGLLKSSDWTWLVKQDDLQQLCREAEEKAYSFSENFKKKSKKRRQKHQLSCRINPAHRTI
jgi:hypothetical protein